MKNFEQPPDQGREPTPQIKLENGFQDFPPEEFINDPVGYFEREGKNIKSGEIKYDEDGGIKEDPTAVKDLPEWHNAQDEQLHTVGKRVNVEKGEIGKSGDPFYEYKILETIRDINLPAPRPVAKAEQDETHLIVMERATGIRWWEVKSLRLKEQGYTDEDIKNLQNEAQRKMEELQSQFEEAGITRGWKLKDMVFDIDVENKRIVGMTPTDWERTKIDKERFEVVYEQKQKHK